MIGVGPKYDNYSQKVSDQELNHIFWRMNNGNFFVKGKKTDSINQF